MDTIPTVSKSSITDLKSHSSSSIAVMSSEKPKVPSSPQLPTKTRSFDDRECLQTTAVTMIVPTTTSAATSASEANVSCKGVDCIKSDDCQEKRKSSENISLQCEINEPNTNVRQENISAVHSNASDTNLESSSLLSDGGKVRSESVSLSASPPKITVMCAPCIDDMLAETAAQQTESIDCDPSDSEESAQNTKIEPQQPTAQCSQIDQCAVDINTGKQTSPTHTTSNLQLSLEVKKPDEVPAQPEDLSPSMDEYEECNPMVGDYTYDTVTGEMLVPGCVAPSSTPAPLIAPLAEIEVDPPDDEMSVSGIEKQPPDTTNTDPVVHPDDTESTAKPQQQHQSHAKKKKQRSTDKGKPTEHSISHVSDV